jgi:hypothetical protein
MSMKNSNDTIGNRTRDLPACSAVPQLFMVIYVINSVKYCTAICYIWITGSFGSIREKQIILSEIEVTVKTVCGSCVARLAVRLIGPTLLHDNISEGRADGTLNTNSAQMDGEILLQKKETNNSEASVHSLCIQYAAFKRKIILIFVEKLKKNELAFVN